MLSQQCLDVLNGVSSSPDAADLITCSVGAAGIANAVSMISVRVLQTCQDLTAYPFCYVASAASKTSMQAKAQHMIAFRCVSLCVMFCVCIRVCMITQLPRLYTCMHDHPATLPGSSRKLSSTIAIGSSSINGNSRDGEQQWYQQW